MRATTGFGLAWVLAWSAGPVPAQDPPGKGGGGLDKLVGAYKLVSGKKENSDVPENRLGGKVVITRDTITNFDLDNKEIYVVRYKIESKDEPYRIAMTVARATKPDAVGSKAHGLIKAEKGQVTLIYDYLYKGNAYPDDFEPKGETEILLVMERTAEKVR
jgi:uncharacterized protein (TIGR03067 family)